MSNPRTEGQLRYLAKKHLFGFYKSRGAQHSNNKGGYQLADLTCNEAVQGLDYDLSLDDLNYWLPHFIEKRRGVKV